ncbi:HTH domain-containing protein [Natrialba sp. PRR66]|uniref:HTH domain-containing protein n=1 Tax=Natrialba sp. PRR66 TaxID=3098146 RepID=UPI002B1CE63C|nr:HTH domain-containing protein [Natrialba sp. PRR66]
MTDAGLTPTQQPPLSPQASLKVDTDPISKLWEQLFDHQSIQDQFVRAVRRFADGRTVPECYDALEEKNVPYWFRSRILEVARGNRRNAWRLAADLVPKLGQGHASLEDLFATAQFFAVHVPDDHPPMVAVSIDRAFEQAPRRKRETICRLFAVLATGFDVRVIATGRTQHWLAREHREDLPGVSEWRETHHPTGDRVDDALEALDPDGRKVDLLRQLADEPAQTLSRHALRAMHDVDRSRISQLLVSETNSLTELGLVAEFGPADDRTVELLEAGRQLLEQLDTQVGRQQELSEAVSDTGTSSQQCRVIPRTQGVGDDGSEDSNPYRTAYLNRPGHAAAAGCRENGGITLVEAPFEDRTDGPDHTRYVSFDGDREEAVVAVRANGALQYVVSLAIALASPRLLNRALTDNRLESLEDPPAILRGARCIGALSDEALEDPERLREAFIEWGTDLEDLTAKLAAGGYEDRNRFRSKIMRSAHGLAGSIIHLLDALKIDIVRELRVPSGLETDSLDELATSLSISAAVQGKYGVFASYRQLFESREAKRRTALTPTVDADDPLGMLIGSVVVRGEDVHRLHPYLEEALERPAAVADDAPEFAVHVSLSTVDRTGYAMAATRILQAKNLRLTRDSISLLQALVSSPYAAARALQQLATEDESRELRPDELRYALGTLDSEQLLADLPPTVARIVQTLLTAENRLSQRDLADRAGVSARTIRNYRNQLEAFDLIRIDENGYRLALSFQTTSERRDSVVPTVLEENQTLLDAADALLETILPPERYSDPDDPLGSVLFWPPDPQRLLDHHRVGPWLQLAAALTVAGSTGNNQAVQMGPPLEQQVLLRTTP